MSIKDTQTSFVSNQVLIRSLKKGVYPSASEVHREIADYFLKQRAGKPSFSLRPIEPHKVSDSESYNLMFKEIKDDLVIGFEELKYLNNQMMALVGYYDSKNTVMNRMISKLEVKANALREIGKVSGTNEVLEDKINDFTHIDFNGDVERNIPKTTAFVDLVTGEALLGQLKGKTIKHDLSESIATFASESNTQKTLHLAPPDNAFIDNVDESWRSIIISKEPVETHGILMIELKEAVYATNLSIVSQSGKPIVCTLNLSEDGVSFKELERRRIPSAYQWSFDRQPVKSIMMKFEKKEEDQQNGMDYEYIFGAKNIELREEQFAKESFFVSKPYEIHTKKAIESVFLEVDDYTYPKTNIRYYLGLDYDAKRIEWQEIERGKELDLDMTELFSAEIDSEYDGYGDFMYSQFGNPFHRIGKFKKEPLSNSIKLQLGRYMWIKETIDATNFSTATDLHKASIVDWARVPTARKEYMRVDKNSDMLQRDTCQRYTTHIYVDKTTTIEGAIQTTDNATHSLYLNNNKHQIINGKYNLTLREGWNTMQIFTYARSADQEIIINFYIREISNKIFAFKEPLEQTSLYDLLHNVSPRVHTKFAVDEDNNIIVNYNPRLADITNLGVEYLVECNFSKTEYDKHKIRLMALLSQESNELKASPKLKGYKITVK